MFKLGCGAGMLLLGGILLIWIAFNVLVQRQAEFKMTVGAILFLLGLFTVGGKWVMEGWSAAQEQFRPRKRKKKRRRPVAEDAE